MKVQLHNALKLLANPPAAPGHGVQVCRATAASLRAGGAVLGSFAQMLMLVTADVLEELLPWDRAAHTGMKAERATVGTWSLYYFRMAQHSAQDALQMVEGQVRLVQTLPCLPSS